MTAVLLSFAACDDNKNKDDGAIVIDSSSKTQTIDASGTTATIAFTAVDSWTLTLTETAATRDTGTGTGAPTWVSASKYEGDAGTHTVTLTFEANTGESARAVNATIKIGTLTATAKITQSGTSGGSTSGKLVKKMTITSSNPESSTVVTTINYDSQDRIKSYTTTGFDGNGTTRTVTFTYETDKVTAAYVYTNSEGSGKGSSVFTLDASGRTISSISKFKQDDESDDEAQEEKATYTYDANGYLIGAVETYDSFSGSISGPGEEPVITKETNKDIYTATWSNGNMTKVVCHEYSDPDDTEWSYIEEQQATYETTAFPASAYVIIGFNLYMGGVDEPLPIFGKLSANLPKTDKRFGGNKDDGINYNSPEYASTYSYEWDGGNLAKIVETEVYYGNSTPATTTTTILLEY